MRTLCPAIGSVCFRRRRRYHRPRDEHKRESVAISATSGALYVKKTELSFQKRKTQKVDFAPEIVVFYQGPMNQAVVAFGRVSVFDNRPAVLLGVSLLLGLPLIGVGLAVPTMSG